MTEQQTARLNVTLDPERIEAPPGGPPVDVTVTLHNLSDKVEQFTLDVVGLEPDWYSAPVTSVGLFPGDRDQVHFTVRPPAGPGFRAAAYPFRLIIRANGSGEETLVEGQLDA